MLTGSEKRSIYSSDPDLTETQGKSHKETEKVQNKNSVISLPVHPTTFRDMSGYIYVIFCNNLGKPLLHEFVLKPVNTLIYLVCCVNNLNKGKMMKKN